jgi:hypothetical protein
LTGAEIKNDLKALGWEGFTADADQQVGQVAAAEDSACDPGGDTKEGWTKWSNPNGMQSGLGSDLKCNGCTEIHYFYDPSRYDDFYRGCGCYKGYCWSTCLILPLYGTGLNNWCYTNSGGHSQDYKYKRCAKNSDCSFHDVKCAGSCTV